MTYKNDGRILTHFDDGTPALWQWWTNAGHKGPVFLGSCIESDTGMYGEPIHTFYGHDTNRNSSELLCYVRTIFTIEGDFTRYEIWHKEDWHEAFGHIIPPYDDAPAGCARC